MNKMELDASEDNGDVVFEAKTNDQIVLVLNALKDGNIPYHGLDIRKANLEEVFLTLTGESLKGGGEEE